MYYRILKGKRNTKYSLYALISYAQGFMHESKLVGNQKKGEKAEHKNQITN